MLSLFPIPYSLETLITNLYERVIKNVFNLQTKIENQNYLEIYY